MPSMHIAPPPQAHGPRIGQARQDMPSPRHGAQPAHMCARQVLRTSSSPLLAAFLSPPAAAAGFAEASALASFPLPCRMTAEAGTRGAQVPRPAPMLQTCTRALSAAAQSTVYRRGQHDA